MTECAIEVSNLRKQLGQQVVLDGVDLSVPAGTVFALLGANGAGKTTLIRILSTLVIPDEGSVRIAGYDAVREQQRVKQAISLTGQFSAVDEVLTAEENLRMMGRLSGLTAAQSRTRAAELLKQFDLVASAGKRVKTYSGGMRRRLDLAISLVVKREVIFLDEPTTGLDAHSRQELLDIIRKLAAQGVTIFLTTQYLEEADLLADTIAVLKGGRIVAQGTAKELKTRIGSDVVELRDEQDQIFRTIPTSGSVHHLKQILDELASSGLDDTRLTIRRPSLDDVFLALTSTELEGSVSWLL